jgi:sodium-dependent dicarboxylate transporter 2/3/5
MAKPATVVVDTRPLWIVLLLRSRQTLLLLAGVGIFLLIGGLKTPAGLSEPGQKALAVFSLCVFYWVLDVLPLMITSLLAIVLLPLTGVLPSKEAYAQFGNEAVFFILGAFILAAAMMKSGLSARLALMVLRRFGHNPLALLRGIFVSNGVMSFFMSEHAVAAMTFPIILEIVAALRLERGRSNYGRALFLSMAWGTTIGGVATLLGGARAPLALGILREVTGGSYSFSEWAAANVPLSAVLFAVGWIVLRVFFPFELTDISAAERAVDDRLLSIGRMTLQERLIGFVMALTVFAWIVLGEEFGLASIALSAVVLLFALRAVRWRDVEGYVNWGLVLMYGGAISLGSALNSTGAAAWLADHTISQWAGGEVSIVLLVSIAAAGITEVMSNSATVAILMPVTVAVAAQFGIAPRIMAPVVAVPAGLSFMLPIGTPANAIAYSSGFLRVRDLLLPGLLLQMAAIVIFNVLVWIYWPLLGIHP